MSDDKKEEDEGGPVPTDPIHMETVSAPTNIACIKYWGKADKEYNTPINSSVSVTLDQADLRAVTTVAASRSFTEDQLWLNGELDERASTNRRFRACVDGVRALATDRIDEDGRITVRRDEWAEMKIRVSSYNTFPTAAGLASSAAGYAALVAALARLFVAREQFDGHLSTIARMGSGSACRSMYGGFVSWRAGGARADRSDSVAEQVASERHWPEIRALILVVSDARKDTSSTDGMGTSVETSELLKHRAAVVVDKRMGSIERAFLERDFETFGQITMADSNQFHATCLDTYPPIFYMNDISRSIIRIVHAYNDWAGQIRAAYTFDAGPNAVLYTLETYAAEVGALMLHYYPAVGDRYINNPEYCEQVKAHVLDESLLEATARTGRTPTKGDVKMMYYTRSGPGPLPLGIEEANLDPKTGLNTYKLT